MSSENTQPFDNDPPMSLDKFMELTGFSSVTMWRYRQRGWINTINLAGRHYVLRSEVARFNKRAADGEFSRKPNQPKRTSSA